MKNQDITNLQNYDAEKSVLGSYLSDDSLFESNPVKLSYFHNPANRILVEAIIEEKRRGVATNNVVALSDSLRSKGWLDQIGGATYLANLLSNRCVTERDLKTNIKILAKYAIYRRLYLELEALQQEVLGAPSDQQEFMGRLNMVLVRVLDEFKEDKSPHIRDIIERLEQTREEFQKEGTVTKTGFDILDKMTGGFFPRFVWIVGAYCLGKGTKVVMWDGSKKNVEDIKVGELLSPVKSDRPTKVLSVAKGSEMMYKITGRYVDSFTANAGHIIPMRWVGDGYDSLKKNKIYNIRISDFVSKPEREKRGYRLVKNMAKYRNKKKLPVPPYFLGLWLGDGNKNRPAITVHKLENEIIDYLKCYAKSNNLHCNVNDYSNSGALDVMLSAGQRGDWRKGRNSLTEKLRKIGVLKDKHVPPDYMTASPRDRLELLAGLIDTDGSRNGAEKNHYKFSNTNERLIRGVKELAESLSFNTYLVKEHKKSIVPSSERRKAGTHYEYDIWNLFISGGGDCGVSDIPVKVPRKKIPCKSASTFNKVTFKVEEIGQGDYYGFVLDGNHLFMAQNFIAQHNTNTGKSFFALQTALNVLRQEKKVMIFSLEMSDLINASRLLGNLGGMGSLEVYQGGIRDERYTEAKDYLEKQKLVLYDNKLDMDEISAACLRESATGQVHLIVIDYVQNLMGRDSDSYENMVNAVKQANFIAQKTNASILLVSQMSNDSVRSPNSRVIGYKGAGELAAGPDVGLTLERVVEEGNKTSKEVDRETILCRVAKNRHGPLGRFWMKIDPTSGLIEQHPDQLDCDARFSIF